VDVRDACEILAGWDHTMDPESRGALLFARYWFSATESAKGEGVSLWSVPFDAENPVTTPNTLDESRPLVARALADAVVELSSAGIALDAKLGDHQYVKRGGKQIPIGGGAGTLGIVNVMEDPSGRVGFPEAPYGSGYMHVVAFNDTPCPDAVTLLAYSQSDDPGSPHHTDQTELFSRKEWVAERFCETDILSSPALEIIDIDRLRADSE
jgi:acyl-homoserine-lactone acylase